MLKLLKSSISCARATAFFTRRFRTTTTLRSTSNYLQKNHNHWRRFTLKETSRLSIVLLFWPVASWVTIIDNQRCRRRLLSCVSTGFKDQASIFRSWLLPGKPYLPSASFSSIRPAFTYSFNMFIFILASCTKAINLNHKPLSDPSTPCLIPHPSLSDSLSDSVFLADGRCSWRQHISHQ